MSTTLTTIGTDMLCDIGVLVPGQVATADILAYLLRNANRMLDTWKLDELFAFAYPAAIYPLQSLLEQYQIGPGQVSPNFNAVRPTGISDANIIIAMSSTPTVRRQLAIWNKDEWAAITVRATNPGDVAPIGAIPIGMYYDDDYAEATGYATINLWPAPQFQPQSLELFTQETMPFDSFATVTTAYNFPPGYENLVRRGLAVECYSGLKSYIKYPVDPKDIGDAWIQARAAVMSANAPDAVKYVEPAYRGQSARRSAFNYGVGTNGGRV